MPSGSSGLYAVSALFALQWVEEMFWWVVRVHWVHQGRAAVLPASLLWTVRRSLAVVSYHVSVGHEMPVGPYDEWLEYNSCLRVRDARQATSQSRF